MTYKGKDGPGKCKHIVLIAADQAYRSEQSMPMPMLERTLSELHGFDCTVLFSVNASTRGIIVVAAKDHPILIGVKDV